MTTAFLIAPLTSAADPLRGAKRREWGSGDSLFTTRRREAVAAAARRGFAPLSGTSRSTASQRSDFDV